MGAWGPGLYQNDTAKDVKSHFLDQLRWGKTAEQITNEMIGQFQEALLDSQDGMDFWCALADVQWDNGRLLSAVKEHAIACLTKEDMLLDWKEAPKKIVSKRRQTLEKLLEKLNTPQPPERRVSQYKLYQCPWNIGDVFALSVDRAFDPTCGSNEKKLLIEIIDFTEWHPGHRIPVVYLKIAEDVGTPLTTASYNEIPYLITRTNKVERDFLMFLKQTPGEHSKVDYMLSCMDEQDRFMEYRIGIITRSKRVIPKDLQFVGNFLDIKHPPKEYIQEEKLNIPAADWKSITEKAMKMFDWYNMQK